MSKLVFNRDGGKTDEFGHLIAFMRFMQGEVIEGLQVAANGTPNMSVNVPYGTAAIPTGSGATGYRYFVGLDATENITIPTANGSNPRNDLIVLWVDKSVTPSQSFTNNSNNMLKISVVSGAPATTPADPSTAAIQAAIGAGNPYIVLARVLTGAGVTQINNGNITDLRSLTGASRVLTDMIATAAIQNLAVTTAKLADGAVTNSKLGANAVTPAKFDFDAMGIMGVPPIPYDATKTGAVYTINTGIKFGGKQLVIYYRCFNTAVSSPGSYSLIIAVNFSTVVSTDAMALNVAGIRVDGRVSPDDALLTIGSDVAGVQRLSAKFSKSTKMVEIWGMYGGATALYGTASLYAWV